jgi:Secretion system C-terminal sorting domain
MKLISTLFENKTLKTLTATFFVLMCGASHGQVSVVCTSPTTVAYGLTSNGEIYEINNTTGATIRVIKNNTYAGNSPSSSNGIGYNSFNSKFYYFKRNVTATPEEFVSFTPATNTVSILAKSTCTADIHTGCISFDGSGYYTVDIQGTLHYYNIALNKWTFITSKIVDQNGNNITNLIKTQQSAGDMAIDGLGNMWILTSSNTNYGLYKFPANLPTTAVAQVNVVCWINPTAVTPTGNSFAGIAFKPNGQILMTTRGDDKLYLLQNISTLTFIGNLTTSDVGNDLTACVFPAGILSVTWQSFDIAVQKNNNIVLIWKVIEYQSKGFYVQQSINGSDWEDIVFIPSKNDPSVTQNYSYSHTNNLNGKQYYRIKQVDIDERISYSEIKSITLKNNMQNITVFPNPATDHIRVISNSGNDNLSKAKIFDLSDRIIAEKKLQSNSNMIMINELPTGTYIIRVETDSGVVYNQKIVKQ